MSKYNLKDLLPEGTDAEYRDAEEATRLEKHPEGDKIKDIQAMMAKEKSMKENYQMDGETYERIDGLINNDLKRKFIFAFEDLYNDMVEAGDEFDKDEVLDYLTIQIDKTLKEISGPKHDDGTPKSNDEMTDDEREDYYNNLDSVDEGDAYDADEDTDAMIAQMKKDGKDADDFVDEGLKEHFQRFLKDYQ